jgi:hypothetical protein
MLSYTIRSITAGDSGGFHAAVDSVARERRYLSFMEAPPFDQIRAFVLKTTDDGLPQFVAQVDGQIVGWCDILPDTRRTVSAHGTLGMGLLPPFRGR